MGILGSAKRVGFCTMKQIKNRKNSMPPLSTFFTDYEDKAFQKWYRKHHDCDHKGVTGDFNIHIRGCGIGRAVIVKCKGCGDKEDITDYECW